MFNPIVVTPSENSNDDFHAQTMQSRVQQEITELYNNIEPENDYDDNTNGDV